MSHVIFDTSQNSFVEIETLLEEADAVRDKSGTSSEQLKTKGYKWLLDSTGKFLFVAACLTVSYLGFLLADALVETLLGFLIGDLIVKYTFVQNGFEGLRIFSAVIISLTYLFHLLYATYDQVHFVIRVFKHMREEEEE